MRARILHLLDPALLPPLNSSGRGEPDLLVLLNKRRDALFRVLHLHLERTAISQHKSCASSTRSAGGKHTVCEGPGMCGRPETFARLPVSRTARSSRGVNRFRRRRRVPGRGCRSIDLHRF